MSLRHEGLWHYEKIEGREAGHEWRVADRDDDVITDFATEKEARVFVRAHNSSLPTNPSAWKT